MGHVFTYSGDQKYCTSETLAPAQAFVWGKASPKKDSPQKKQGSN